MFDNFNNLWQHNNTLNNFFNITCSGLKLNCCIVVLNDLSFTWNFICLDFGLIHNYFSKNLFWNLFLNKMLGFIDNFFNFFLNNLDLSLMMNFFFNFFNLINKGTNRYISIGLNFNRNLFVVNVMFWCIDFNKVRLFNIFRDMNWE